MRAPPSAQERSRVFRAAAENRGCCIRRWFASGTLTKESKDAKLALFEAARCDAADAVKALLDGGIPPNVHIGETGDGEWREFYAYEDDDYWPGGDTPLFYAGTPEVARLLIDAGANVNFDGNAYCQRPLDIAVRRGLFDVVQVLVEAGACVDGHPEGHSQHGPRAPIQAAVIRGCEDIAQYLLDKGAALGGNYSDVNFSDIYADDMLEYCSDEFGEILLNRGLIIHEDEMRNVLCTILRRETTKIAEMVIDKHPEILTFLADITPPESGEMRRMLVRKRAALEAPVG